MKKSLCLLLAFLMTVCGAAAAENAIDLSAMTLDELVALRNSVSAEIDKRTTGEPSILPAGVYVAGQSIKVGNYTITAPEDDYLHVGVFTSMEGMQQCKSETEGYQSLYILNISIYQGESAFVSLTDGMVLVTDGQSEIKTPTADWLP